MRKFFYEHQRPHRLHGRWVIVFDVEVLRAFGDQLALRSIHIFAQGAPSHVDTWDPKPSLTRLNGKTIQMPKLGAVE